MPHRLGALLIVAGSAIVGAWFSSVVFGPFVGLTPTDPRGPSIAAGLGGLVGLAVGLILRLIVVRNPTH